MEKQILVTKTLGNINYQLYRTKVIYPTRYIRGEQTFEQEVTINGFGIIVTIFIGQEVLYYDSGPISAQNYEANSVFHLLCRLRYDSLDLIRETVWNEYRVFCRGSWGDPFSKAAR